MLFVALTRCFALACFVAVAAASAATYDPACEAGIEAFREIQECSSGNDCAIDATILLPNDFDACKPACTTGPAVPREMPFSIERGADEAREYLANLTIALDACDFSDSVVNRTEYDYKTIKVLF